MDGNPETLFDKMEQLNTEISNISPASKQSDEALLTIMCRALQTTGAFDTIIEVIMAHSFDYDIAKERIQAFYEQHQHNTAQAERVVMLASTTAASSKPHCNYCKRVGHTADQCYYNPSNTNSSPSVLVCQACGTTGHGADVCHDFTLVRNSNYRSRSSSRNSSNSNSNHSSPSHRRRDDDTNSSGLTGNSSNGNSQLADCDGNDLDHRADAAHILYLLNSVTATRDHTMVAFTEHWCDDADTAVTHDSLPEYSLDSEAATASVINNADVCEPPSPSPPLAAPTGGHAPQTQHTITEPTYCASTLPMISCTTLAPSNTTLMPTTSKGLQPPAHTNGVPLPPERDRSVGAALSLAMDRVTSFFFGAHTHT
eukprot:5921-Heterococcus_DN1.PRE.2